MYRHVTAWNLGGQLNENVFLYLIIYKLIKATIVVRDAFQEFYILLQEYPLEHP